MGGGGIREVEDSKVGKWRRGGLDVILVTGFRGSIIGTIATPLHCVKDKVYT
jgi:hypothetical protein